MADGGMGITGIDVGSIADALKVSKRGAEQRAAKEAWPYTEEAVRGGRRRRYNIALLPADVQAAIQRATAIAAAASDQLAARTPAFEQGQRLARRLSIAESVDTAVEQRERERGSAAAAGLTGTRKARADAKLDLLARLAAFAKNRALGVCAAMVEFCDAYNSGQLTVPVTVRHHTGAALHPATLRRWRKLHKTKGAAALGGSYGNRACTGKLDTNVAMRDFVIGLIAEKPHISAKLVREALDARFPSESLPHRSNVERWLAKWKADNAEIYLAATDPDAWKNRHMAAFGSLSESVQRVCELWMLDSTPADLQLVDGRYSLVGLIDVHSRTFRLHVTKTSTAEAVCQIMRRGILELGVPDAIKCDNGQDYVSDRVASLVNALHIEPRFSAPFSPWEKGIVERSFRTFSHSLLELLPGYTGHNVAEAQAIRSRESFADRMFKKNAVVEVKLTAAELQDFCDRWCRDYYAHQPHASLDNETPFQRYAASRDVVKRIGDVRALDLLLGTGEMRKVGKKGLRIEKLNYIAPELASVIGQDVLVRVDDADIGRAVVYHQEQFLCVAECPEVTGVSRREIAIEAKAKQTKRVQEAKADLRAAKRKANTRDIAFEILDRKAEQYASLSALPAPNVLHITPALEAAAEAAAALERHNAPADPLGPTTEAHVAEVMQLLRDERTADETNVTRFARALRAMAAPENQIEAQWLKGYRQSSEFRGNWMVFEEFGAGTFGLGSEFDALRDAADFHNQGASF